MTTSSGNVLPINVKKIRKRTFSHDISFNMKVTFWIYLLPLSIYLSTVYIDDVESTVEFPKFNADVINSYYDYLTGLGLNKLCSYMRTAEIDAIIGTLGPFTLFAPTDNAFDLIPQEYLKVIQNNEMLLQEFILGHIMNNFVALHGIANEALLPCISGAPIRFNVYSEREVITVSGAQVIQPGQRYGSMLVYMVDRVVFPISGIDIFNYTRDSYSYFHELLNLAGINLLPGRAYTLFAPLSQSFQTLPKAALDLLYENKTLLKDVLLNHLVENTYFTAGLTEGTTILKTVGGSTLTITPRRGLILVNGVPIIKPDIHLSNGVLHGITRIIFPRTFLDICKCIPLSTAIRQSSIVANQRYFIPKRPTVASVTQIIPRYGARIGPVPSGFLFISPPANHTVAAVTSKKTVLQVIQTPLLITGHRTATLTIAADLFKRAGLLDTLAKTHPLTTILPTDEAFANLPNGTLEQLKSDTQALKELLLCHLIAKNAVPAELQNSLRLPTYGGVSLSVKIVRRKLVLIGGCQVVAVSRVTNGIVYIVDRVLYPRPVQNLLTALKVQPLASTFLDLALKAKLEVLLTGQSFSTCFVPTNAAFSLISSEVMQKLLTDPYFLRAFILRHCVSGLHFSKEFTDYLTLISHLREDLKFEIEPDGIYVNGAKIVVPDICTGNGVLHLVDSILNPPQIPDLSDEIIEESTTMGCTTKEMTTEAAQATVVTTEGEMEMTTEMTTASEAEMTTESETEKTTESETEMTTESQTEMTTESETEITTESQTEMTTESETEMTTESQTEMTTEGETEMTTESQTEMTTESETEMTTESKTEVTTESETEVTTESTTPMPSLQEAIQGEGIDTFVRWLNESGYLESIQDGGEYTIFVPTDEAIDSIPPTLRNVIENQARKKTKTLKHHIVPSLVDLDQLPDETTLPTLLPGKDIRINKYNDLITASGAPTGKRIKVGNVQFVTIDRVLEPPTSDLLAAVSKSALLKKIAKIIEVAGLQDELKNGGPYTFYAPSKRAFRKLPPEVINSLLTDPSAAKDFVLRHLVRGAKYSSGMDDGSIAITENGNLLGFTSQPGRMKVNNANINFSDINATNGVLHIIDDVL